MAKEKRPPKYLFEDTIKLVESERIEEQARRKADLTFAGFVDELCKIGLRVLARKREKEQPKA